MTLDATLERVRAANPAHPATVDADDLFAAIVTSPGDPRFGRNRRLPLGRGRLVLVALVLFLVLAGTATAMYYVLRGSPAGLVLPRAGGYAVLDASGRPRDLSRWHCPRHLSCGNFDGVAFSPDGKRLAFSSDAEGGDRSTYPGFHIIDLRTGADRRIPALRRYVQTAPLRTRIRLQQDQTRIFGCATPSYLSWSRDGSRIAYTCWGTFTGTHIYTIRPDGTGRRLIPTRTANAFSPTWSPDDRQIAFSTDQMPTHSSVYVIDLDGRNERRLAAGALPNWSPQGNAIAYVALGCGASWERSRIRVVTTTGSDATPSRGGCPGIGPTGSRIATWSPDGSRIAVETFGGVYVMNADGSGLERLRRGNFLVRAAGASSGGPLLRPLWQPLSTRKQK
jgi:dipeptidyl aminopeptidase/acylaminoacyl peptidase